MDQTLAKIYGTNEEVQDAEKLASAELAEKLAEGEELNLDGLSTDDLEALAQQVLSGNADEGAEEQTEEQVESEDAEEEKTASDGAEAEEKLAEADYLGRVMAHSYVQELKNIEKTAGKMDALKGAGKKVLKSGRSAMKAVKGQAKDVGRGFKDIASLAKTPRASLEVMKHDLKNNGVKATLKANKHIGKALGVAGAAGAAGAVGAKKMMDKKSEAEQVSALDQLAIERAKEILAENGVALQEEKTASLSEEQVAVLQNAVQARAVELLEAEGFSFEDGEEATEE